LPWEDEAEDEEPVRRSRQKTPDGDGEPAAKEPESTEATADVVAEPPAQEPSPNEPAGTEEAERRAGKPEGAPGYGRTQVIPPSRTEVHRPAACAACGAPLSADAPFVARMGFYVVDIEVGEADRPGLDLQCILHRYGESTCHCGHRTASRPGTGERFVGERRKSVTELSEWRLIGPTLASLIVCLALRMRLSRAKTREWLRDWLHLELSTGVIDQCVREAGLAAAPLQEPLVEEVRQSALAHADETPWKEHGRVPWLWVFVTAEVVLFRVGRRTRDVLRSVLGETFTGWLMSDGLSHYREYPRRLRCLAHLQRKARGLVQSLDREAQAFGEMAQLTLQLVVNQVRDGPDPPAYQPFLGLFRELCQAHWDAKHDKTRALAREFLNDWAAIWAVLDHPDKPLTNNVAERALRHWVIARSISYGTRTPEGSRTVSVLASVIETCRLRGVLPWPYLATVIAERRKGNPAPPLPVAP
jgi:transposase